MPVPTPNKGEEREKYLSRCIGFLSGENNKKPAGERRPANQIAAICYSQWKEHAKAEQAELDKKEEAKFIAKFIENHPEYAKYFKIDSD